MCERYVRSCDSWLRLQHACPPLAFRPYWTSSIVKTGEKRLKKRLCRREVQHSIFLSAFCTLRFSLSPPFPFSPSCCRQSMDHFKPWCLSFQLAVFHQVESLSFLWKRVIIDGGNISTYYTLTYWIDIIWACLKMRCTAQIIEKHWTWWLDNRFGGAQISDKPMCYPCAFCVPVASRCCAAGWTRWKHRGARCAEGHLFFKTPTKMTKARFSYCPIHTFTILHMNICRPQLLLLEHFSPAYACWTINESPLALLTNQQILQHGSRWLQPDSRSVVSGSQRQQRPLMRRHIGRLGLPPGDDEHGSTVTWKSWVYRITSEICRRYMQKMLLQCCSLEVLTSDKPIVWFTGAELHRAE